MPLYKTIYKAFISNVVGVVVDHSRSYYAFANNKLGPKVRSKLLNYDGVIL